MARFIPPKPTIYQGVRYRSRLEAGWAVFLEQFTGSRYTYEDFRGNPQRCRPTGTDLRAAATVRDRDVDFDFLRYVPDFRVIRPGNTVRFFLELKPVVPNGEYLGVLRKVQERIGALGYQLLLLVGSVRDGDGGQPPTSRLYPYDADSLCEPLFVCLDVTEDEARSAYRYARSYRWDLHEDAVGCRKRPSVLLQRLHATENLCLVAKLAESQKESLWATYAQDLLYVRALSSGMRVAEVEELPSWQKVAEVLRART